MSNRYRPVEEHCESSNALGEEGRHDEDGGGLPQHPIQIARTFHLAQYLKVDLSL